MRQILIAAAALAAGSAVAQEAGDNGDGAKPQRPNPCDAAPYRAFDFWLGDWDVFATNGDKAGENAITIEENGCLLIERWTSVQGGTGQSYNFYDPGMEKFRQVWVSLGAVIDYAGELNEDGAMVLEGDINYRNGTSFPFRGTWTLQEDGSVRQHFQQKNLETDNWDDWFIGIYRKKGSE